MTKSNDGLMKLNLQQFAEPAADGAGAAGDNAPGGDVTDPATGAQKSDGADTQGENGGTEVEKLNAEIARLQAEMAKQKTALDKATHEASVANKAVKAKDAELKAKMTAEEIAAKEKEEADTKAAQELDELRREVAKAKTVKSVMGKLSMDEETAGEMADSLYGAANIENALLLFQKIWTAKEKALRMEFGRIPAPGTGGSSEDKETQEALRLAKELGQQKAQSATSVRDQLKGLVR